MSINITNYQQNETVSCPLVLVKGTCTTSGLIRVIHHGLDQNKFPAQYFSVDNGCFRALVHLEGGENTVYFQLVDGEIRTDETYRATASVVVHRESNTFAPLKIHYVPVVQNKPIHVCMIVAKDSPLVFDTPGYKKAKEGNGFDLAVRKLRLGCRLMQTYTLEEMRANGFGNRTFAFAEEWTCSSLSKQDFDKNGEGRAHMDIKVHVITSRKTLAELRDPNMAQQNPKGSNTGGLFSHALDELKHYGGPFEEGHRTAQAAVMYLDATWDTQLQLILAHAALGGGDDRISLAIFGSQGLHSWPSFVEDIIPAFQDDTRLSITEVANDCNQCGTSWETFTLSMGAFMHEIGHSLGSPHQESGVMLRDYIFLQRSFCTRETYCERTKAGESLIGRDGKWPNECHWHRLDLIRYLHHGSLGLPTDAYDPSFQKRTKTLGNGAKPVDQIYTGVQGQPLGFHVSQGCIVKSTSGIYLVEMDVDGLARAWIEYLPKTVGGPGQQYDLLLNYEELQRRIPERFRNKKMHVRVLSGCGDFNIDDFEKYCHEDSTVRLGGGVVGYKSTLLGRSLEHEVVAQVDMNSVIGARVYHGRALDGIRFFVGAGAPPALPPRNYGEKQGFLGKVTQKLKDVKLESQSPQVPVHSDSVLFGKETKDYTDFMLNPGERFSRFHFRNGGWVDAVVLETTSGRRSANLGGGGGHVTTLEAPPGLSIQGWYGFMDRWVYGIGIVYG